MTDDARTSVLKAMMGKVASLLGYLDEGNGRIYTKDVLLYLETGNRQSRTTELSPVESSPWASVPLRHAIFLVNGPPSHSLNSFS